MSKYLIAENLALGDLSRAIQILPKKAEVPTILSVFVRILSIFFRI